MKKYFSFIFKLKNILDLVIKKKLFPRHLNIKIYFFEKIELFGQSFDSHIFLDLNVTTSYPTLKQIKQILCVDKKVIMAAAVSRSDECLAEI